MFSRINCILLIAVTLSALYVTDLRLGIKRQTHLYAKGQEEEIRLNQDKAELTYERSRLTDARAIEEAAEMMKMHQPTEKDTVSVQY